MRTIVVAAVALSLGFAAGGCGSSSGDDGGEKQVRAAIHTGLTSHDPAACTQLFTRAYVEQTALTHGAGAVGVCRETLRRGEPARDTKISKVSVTGTRARADVAVQGGDEDGSHYDLRLVQRGGRWRLDRIAGVELEFERYLRAGRRQLARPPEALSGREADCVVGRIRRIGEARLEKAIVAADARIASDSVVPCLGRRSLRRQFEAGIRSGLPDEQGDCVVAQLRDSISEQQIRDFVRSSLTGAEPTSQLRRAVARALIACGGGPGGGGGAQSA